MPEMLGIGVALQSRLAPFVASPDLQTDIQARYVRTLSVPEYYPEYRDTGNGIAGFLGASIVAKVYRFGFWGHHMLKSLHRSYSMIMEVRTLSRKLTIQARAPTR